MAANFKKKYPKINTLINQGMVIEGLKIWGSPVTPSFMDWAWNADRGPNIRKYWEMIPEDTELLITHGPPQGILDYSVFSQQSVGCNDLAYIIETKLKALKLHVFGHIHFSHGVKLKDGITYINASICDERYYPGNSPIIYEFD